MITRSLIVRHSSLDPSYIPVRFRREVLRLGNNSCVFCGKKEKHDVCYDIPRCQGGKIEVDNLLVCCEKCRREKDSRTAAEYREMLKWRGVSENVHTETTKKPIPLEIYFLDGEVLRGKTKDLPGKTTRDIWVTLEGDGQAVFVNLDSVKMIVFKGAQLEELEKLPISSS